MLKTSTIRAWLETFSEEVYGTFNYGAPMFHRIEYGDLRATFDFIGLDNIDDIERLLSTEYTGGFPNEATSTEKALVDEAQSCLCYPPANMARVERRHPRRQCPGRGPLARDDERPGRSLPAPLGKSSRSTHGRRAGACIFSRPP